MCNYIDISKIVEALPENVSETLKPSRHNYHHDIKIELPMFSADKEMIKCGESKQIQSCSILFNFPDSHYGEIKGFSTNIGLHSIGGVLKGNFSGYLYIKAYNSGIEPLTLPSGMFIGTLVIKKFYEEF